MKNKNGLCEGLSILLLWTIVGLALFGMLKLYEHKKAEYPRIIVPVTSVTCTEREDGPFFAPTKYVEQRFIVTIGGQNIIGTSRYDVIVPGTLVQLYFDGFDWIFEKVIRQ